MVVFRTPSGRGSIHHDQRPDIADRYARGIRGAAQATADAAGTRVRSVAGEAAPELARHAHGRAPATRSTSRRDVSHGAIDSAYQQYWTGVKARDVFGKFTFIPTPTAAEESGVRRDDRGPQHLTEDWRVRQSRGPLEFSLEWIPYLSERETPLDDLTTPWHDDRKVRVGTVTFPKIDPDAMETKLIALLASELGANPGNWQETPDEAQASLPATLVGRSLCFAQSCIECRRSCRIVRMAQIERRRDLAGNNVPSAGSSAPRVTGSRMWGNSRKSEVRSPKSEV
jgi:hypothetical protein